MPQSRSYIINIKPSTVEAQTDRQSPVPNAGSLLHKYSRSADEDQR